MSNPFTPPPSAPLGQRRDRTPFDSAAHPGATEAIFEHHVIGGRLYGTRTHTVLLYDRSARVRVVDVDLELDSAGAPQWVEHSEELHIVPTAAGPSAQAAA